MSLPLQFHRPSAGLAATMAAAVYMLLASTSAVAQAPAERPAGTAQQANQPLRVAVKTVPPFAMQNEAGEWVGISVELWQDIAKSLGTTFTWLPVDTVSAEIRALENGTADLAVGAITVTAEREQKIDFSNPFYNTGIGIATNTEGTGLLGSIRGLLSAAFLKAVGVLSAVLLGLGVLIWLLERRRNPQFGRDPVKGIGNGFWWSAVTMTTVGYGDKAPITLGGRVLGTIWMFISIITISGFTAAIASSFTLSQLGAKVQEVSDLYRVRTATIANSSSSEMLQTMNIGSTGYQDSAVALRDVNSNKVDALVYDKPLLQYLLKQSDLENVNILPQTLAKQDYAIALRANSPLREPINQALLTIIQSNDWDGRLQRYLGEE